MRVWRMRNQMDVAVVPHLCRQRRPPPAPRPGLQPRQLHAHAGNVQARGAMVADQPAREADHDRRQGGEPRPLHRLPDGGSPHPENAQSPISPRCPASASSIAPITNVRSNHPEPHAKQAQRLVESWTFTGMQMKTRNAASRASPRPADPASPASRRWRNLRVIGIPDRFREIASQ